MNSFRIECKKILSDKTVIIFLLIITSLVILMSFVNIMLNILEYNQCSMTSARNREYLYYALDYKSSMMSTLMNTVAIYLPVIIPYILSLIIVEESENKTNLILYTYYSRVKLIIARLLIMLIIFNITMISIFLTNQLINYSLINIFNIRFIGTKEYEQISSNYFSIFIIMNISTIYFSVMNIVIAEYTRSLFIYPLLCIIFFKYHLNPFIPFTFYSILLRKFYFSYPTSNYFSTLHQKTAIVNLNIDIMPIHIYICICIFLAFLFITFKKKVWKLF